VVLAPAGVLDGLAAGGATCYPGAAARGVWYLGDVSRSGGFYLCCFGAAGLSTARAAAHFAEALGACYAAEPEVVESGHVITSQVHRKSAWMAWTPASLAWSREIANSRVRQGYS
jgi:hypothetical protein